MTLFSSKNLALIEADTLIQLWDNWTYQRYKVTCNRWTVEIISELNIVDQKFYFIPVCCGFVEDKMYYKSTEKP